MASQPDTFSLVKLLEWGNDFINVNSSSECLQTESKSFQAPSYTDLVPLPNNLKSILRVEHVSPLLYFLSFILPNTKEGLLITENEF